MQYEIRRVMPQRVLNSLGQLADAGIFGAALAVIAGRLIGLSVSDAGALMTGLAAVLIAAGRLLVAVGQAVKYFAEARHTVAEAKVKETFTQPEVYRMLERLKCWNAPDCPTREIFKPEE
jgi:hypothetical protein